MLLGALLKKICLPIMGVSVPLACGFLVFNASFSDDDGSYSVEDQTLDGELDLSLLLKKEEEKQEEDKVEEEKAKEEEKKKKEEEEKKKEEQKEKEAKDKKAVQKKTIKVDVDEESLEVVQSKTPVIKAAPLPPAQVSEPESKTSPETGSANNQDSALKNAEPDPVQGAPEPSPKPSTSTSRTIVSLVPTIPLDVLDAPKPEVTAAPLPPIQQPNLQGQPQNTPDSSQPPAQKTETIQSSPEVLEPSSASPVQVSNVDDSTQQVKIVTSSTETVATTTTKQDPSTIGVDTASQKTPEGSAETEKQQSPNQTPQQQESKTTEHQISQSDSSQSAQNVQAQTLDPKQASADGADTKSKLAAGTSSQNNTSPESTSLPQGTDISSGPETSKPTTQTTSDPIVVNKDYIKQLIDELKKHESSTEFDSTQLETIKTLSKQYESIANQLTST